MGYAPTRVRRRGRAYTGSERVTEPGDTGNSPGVRFVVQGRNPVKATARLYPQRGGSSLSTLQHQCSIRLGRTYKYFQTAHQASHTKPSLRVPASCKGGSHNLLEPLGRDLSKLDSENVSNHEMAAIERYPSSLRRILLQSGAARKGTAGVSEELDDFSTFLSHGMI